MASGIRSLPVAGFVLSLLFASPLWADDPRAGEPFAKEIAEIEKLRKEGFELELAEANHLMHLLGSFELAKYEKYTESMLEGLDIGRPKLRALAQIERLPLSDGQPSDFVVHRVEMLGTAPYAPLHHLFVRWSIVFGGSRAQLESLHLDAVAGNQVRYQARFAVPHYEPAADKPQPEVTLAEVGGVLAARNARRKLSIKLLEQLEARSQTRALIDGLAALINDQAGRALGFSTLHSEGIGVLLDGVALGGSARAGLEDALVKAGFYDVRLSFPPGAAGRCQPFKATLRVGRTSEVDSVEEWNGLFDSGIAELCRNLGGVPASDAAAVEIQGATPTAAGIYLRLRGLGAIEAFQVLHELTGEAFVIDPEVSGRLRFDVRGATLDELFAGLAAAGYPVGSGPLHRVSPPGRPAGNAAAAERIFTGDPMAMTLPDADLVSTLCTLGVVSGKEIWMAGKPKGKVHLFADDLPWDQLLDGLLAANGLTWNGEVERILVGPEPAAGLAERSDLAPLCKRDESSPEWKPPAASRLATMTFEGETLGRGDLELVGLGQWNEKHLALAYPPNGRNLLFLETGDEIAGATVESIESDGLTLLNPGGARVGWPLEPAPRP